MTAKFQIAKDNAQQTISETDQIVNRSINEAFDAAYKLLEAKQATIGWPTDDGM